MSWEDYEAMIYREVASRSRVERLSKAISEALGDRTLEWSGWPGSVPLAKALICALDE
jgi:hypothetical protein